MKSIVNSYVLYQGASVLDGQQIVVIASGFAKASANDKTGDMIQTFIMRADIEPHQAVKTGEDSSVCGSCPHRHFLGGSCYVTTHQAPLSVYRAWKRGTIPAMTDYSLFEGRLVRFGAYGDPAAVPASVWSAVASVAKGNTGYTHQLGHKAFDREILNYCMVSADTPKQAQKAHDAGLRTFRVKVEGTPLLEGEIECLADSKGLSCAECKLCHSATAEAVSIAIDVHGSKAKRYTSKFEGVTARHFA